MQQLRQHTEWANFFSAQLVEREKAEAEAANAYEIAKASAFDSGAKTVTAGKAARDADPRVLGAYQRWHDAKYDRKAMETVVKSQEAYANIASREISRRVGRDGPQRRVDWNGGG